MDTQTRDESTELYDRAQEAAGFPTAADVEALSVSTEELVADAREAAREGRLLYIQPNALLAVLGLPPVAKDKGESVEDEGDEPDQTEEPGDDRIRQPEHPEGGPTSQPGPAGEPGGPSQTPSNPAPAAP